MPRALQRTVPLILGLVALVGAARVSSAATVEDVQVAVMQGDQAYLEYARVRLRAVPASRVFAPERLYLRAYVAWRLSYFLPRESERSQSLLAEAQDDLEALLNLEPESADVLVLLATVNGSRVTGWWSALRRGRRSLKDYEKALELAPANPRVVLLVGISRLFRPGRFGGSLERAQEDLVRARALFARESADEPWPNWGEAEALAWLGQAALRAGDLDGAEAWYREALAVEPGYDWVLRSLLPELESRRQTASRGGGSPLPLAAAPVP